MTGRLIVFGLFGVLAASLLAGTARASVLSDEPVLAAKDGAASTDHRRVEVALLDEILAGHLLPQQLSSSDFDLFAWLRIVLDVDGSGVDALKATLDCLPSDAALELANRSSSPFEPSLLPIAETHDFQFASNNLSAETLAMMAPLPPQLGGMPSLAPAVASHPPQRTGSIRLLASTFSHQIGMAFWGVIGAICVAAGCAGPGAPRWTAINTYRIYRAMGLALPEQLFGRPQRELAPVELPISRISTPAESPAK